jgi:hypothetical protein
MPNVGLPNLNIKEVHVAHSLLLNHYDLIVKEIAEN